MLKTARFQQPDHKRRLSEEAAQAAVEPRVQEEGQPGRRQAASWTHRRQKITTYDGACGR